MKTGVYFLYCLGNGKYYIGSGDMRRRRNHHLAMLRQGKHGNPELQAAFNTHSEGSFRFVVAEYVEPEDLTEREQKWLDSFNEVFLFNVERKAKRGQMAGRKHKPETIEKMRLAARGRRPTHNCLQKSAELRRGKPNWNSGRTLSPEHRQKLSKSHK